MDWIWFLVTGNFILNITIIILLYKTMKENERLRMLHDFDFATINCLGKEILRLKMEKEDA